MKTISIISILVGSLLLSACSSDGGLNKEDGGAIVGAVAGGLLGNTVGKGSGRVLATMAGVMVGGIVGSSVGRSLDKADQLAASKAEFDALEKGRSGRAVKWRNPDNGHYGEIVPERSYRVGRKQCRSFRHTIYIDGRRETMKGRACRNHDGTWRKVT